MNMIPLKDRGPTSSFHQVFFSDLIRFSSSLRRLCQIKHCPGYHIQSVSMSMFVEA